ncbi:hypothetical protein [Cupriavidus sp. SK-4]|uniref:hypothetical protein n=1 Tax=Cupriavidus sp. SK-4 TaxID=574750 RepID=UPI00056AF183|nr:hypothetical protein [Cupriavidus sp. SK-4]
MLRHASHTSTAHLRERMPALPAKHHAAELLRQLRSLLAHEQMVTQAYGLVTLLQPYLQPDNY